MCGLGDSGHLLFSSYQTVEDAVRGGAFLVRGTICRLFSHPNLGGSEFHAGRGARSEKVDDFTQCESSLSHQPERACPTRILGKLGVFLFLANRRRPSLIFL